MTKKNIKKKVNTLNTKLVGIVQTLYGVARTKGALEDGQLPSGALRPSKWQVDMKETADEYSTRILRDVVHKAIKPYEEALKRYAVYHLPGCSTWQGESKECDCGVEYLQSVLRANQTLFE